MRQGAFLRGGMRLQAINRCGAGSPIWAAPPMRSTSLPCLKISNAGMLCTRKRAAVVRFVIHVELGDSDSAGKLGSQIFDHWRKLQARPAPWSPHVDEDRQRRAFHNQLLGARSLVGRRPIAELPQLSL